MEFSSRISKVIEYSKLSPSEFADEIDVQRSSISHVTSGRNNPSLEFVRKIKNRFPELEYEWLIEGTGEMLQPEKNDLPVAEAESKKLPTSLPDLFSLIDDDNFGITESEDRIQKETPRESDKPEPTIEKEKISDSQRLGIEINSHKFQTIDNQQNKIKRIVLFFENGRFESFEP